MQIFISRAYAFIQEQPALNTHVNESLLTRIQTYSDLNKLTFYENVIQRQGLLTLSDSGHKKGSLIKFKEPVKTQNFSMILDLEHLKLKDSDISGVYAWFTTEPISKGELKNGPSLFKGFMGGIEFSHNKARFVFSYNHGSDYKETQHFTTIYDKIDESRLHDLTDLRLKIIHTDKNIKFELYDEDRIISDTFKINDPELIELEGDKAYVGITSYYENSKSTNLIELKTIEFYDRKESDQYDNMDLHVEYNTHTATESNEAVVEAAANVAHFVSYLTAVFGIAGELPIHQMIVDFKDKNKKLQEQADEIINGSNMPIREEENTEISETMKYIDNQMKDVYDTLKKMKKQVDSMHGNYTNHHNLISKEIICFGIFFTVVTLVRVILSKNKQSRKTLKSLD